MSDDSNSQKEKTSEPTHTKQPVKSNIPEDIWRIIDDPEIPEKKKKEFIRMMVSARQTMFQGPLPPPELLEAYNKIIPNGAERIVAMAEKQS